MFSLFSNTKREDLTIIIDIQSGLVRGALVNYKVDGSINILSVITESISTKNHIVNSKHLTKRIIKLVTEIVRQLASIAGKNNIVDIHYILSSPWIMTELKTIKIDYKDEIVIDSTIVGNLVRDELNKHSEKNDTRIIEKKIWEIKLNGYTMEDYEGKNAHSLEIALSYSVSPIEFLNILRSTVHNIVHIKNQHYHSALLMQYSAIRLMLDKKREYIYIHAHNELTDIVIVKNGLCKYLASFPFGTSTILRKISSNSSQSMEASDSLLSLYDENKLHDTEKVLTQKVIDPLMHTWSTLCLKTFSNAFEFTNIPRTVYLSVHSHFNIFKDALLFKNDLNFEIIPYESLTIDNNISFGKGTVQSTMMKMYTLAVKSMI